MSKYVKYYEEVKRLNKEGYRNCEIAKKINIDSRRVGDILRKLNIKRNENETYYYIELTSKEEEVLIGNIIGDGCIFKDSRGKHYRMNLAHSLKQKEYFMKKYKILKRLIKSDPKVRTWIDKRTNKKYSEIRYQTVSNIIFNDYYNTWYKNGKKIIPYSELNKINETVIAIKFFDDGSFIRNAGYIAMNNYDEESIYNLRYVLKNRFDIKTTLHKNNQIYIPKKEFNKFKEIVKPFSTSDVLYKLGEFGGTPNVKARTIPIQADEVQ